MGALATAAASSPKSDDYDHRGGEIVTYIVDRNVNYTKCPVTSIASFAPFIVSKKMTMPM